MTISFDRLQSLIASSSYLTNGSPTEKSHAHVLAMEFPNSELFWKTFIVPFTNRIDESISDYAKSMDPRTGVDAKLHLIGSYHYSIFHNFIFAYEDLRWKCPSFFESFYTHLGTMCDCVEEFLIYLYYIILECKGEKSKSLRELSKNEFLIIAEQWYDSNYETLFEHYLSKGKTTKVPIIENSFVLDEWFQKDKSWKTYKTFSQKIRQYRNVIVHGHTRPVLNDQNGNNYVPKKERIGDYKRWTDNQKAIDDPSLFERDFILRETLMNQDMHEMKAVLQALWEIPIREMNELLFVQKNKSLLEKYNLQIE